LVALKKSRSMKVPVRPRGSILGAKWSNIPVEARVCLVTVGLSPKDHWANGMVGQERKVIEVKMPGAPGKPDEVGYIDNEDGWALGIFLKGLAPLPGFRYVPTFFVKDDPTAEPLYKAKFHGWQF
jgi:hypothetical protein